jgi:hypothetical protein
MRINRLSSPHRVRRIDAVARPWPRQQDRHDSVLETSVTEAVETYGIA